jgi:hypothetical protein
MKKISGLSIIEMTVFVLAASIFAYFAITNSGYFIKNARSEILHKDLDLLRQAIFDYYRDHSKYPPNLTRLTERCPEPYLSSIPRDPFTGTDDWQVNRTGSGWGSRNPESLTEEITDVRSSAIDYQSY